MVLKQSSRELVEGLLMTKRDMRPTEHKPAADRAIADHEAYGFSFGGGCLILSPMRLMGFLKVML